ncbi:MAG: hypothetical protein KDD44_05175, partial [Bdellovibrionales bacterium]|nr:hypothetical protein [Bdellovibrionales bacterium]
VEGETDDAAILDLRDRQRRNLIATLLLSAGVPMISGGDELSHTQSGNNNAYCQDNRLSWYPWALLRDERFDRFRQFVSELVAFRHSQPVLQRRKFFTGEVSPRSGCRDVTWITPGGSEMNGGDWSELSAFGVCFSGDSIDEVDDRGNEIVGDTLLVLLSSKDEPIDFRVPGVCRAERWELMFDTRFDTFADRGTYVTSGNEYSLAAHSIAVFRRTNDAEERENTG